MGDVILATIQGSPVGPGEMTVVCGPHVAFLAINAGFPSLEVPGFAGSQLPALYALRDAPLLIVLALFDVAGLLRQR